MRKMALSKKCIEILMAKHAGRARKGVCLNVKEGLMAKQTNITLEEQEQEMGLNKSFDQQVKFPEKKTTWNLLLVPDTGRGAEG